jgi:hypothetical protein
VRDSVFGGVRRGQWAVIGVADFLRVVGTDFIERQLDLMRRIHLVDQDLDSSVDGLFATCRITIRDSQAALSYRHDTTLCCWEGINSCKQNFVHVSRDILRRDNRRPQTRRKPAINALALKPRWVKLPLNQRPAQSAFVQAQQRQP